MTDLDQIDALFVGAGPASLAGAIRLKQLLKENGRSESVVVIEKAGKPGRHNLSGAVFESAVLDELLPGWRESRDRFVVRALANEVERDDLYYLPNARNSIRIPDAIVPRAMRHKGDLLVSVSELVGWLAGVAADQGVEVYPGFAAREVLFEDDWVKGVRLVDRGVDREGRRQSNFVPGERLSAGVTVLGEGSLGPLAEQVIRRFELDRGRNARLVSLGVKEIIRLPAGNTFGSKRAVHSTGFPNLGTFGGGTIYSMGENLVAVALVLGLDWKYADLNPHHELQVFKSHKLVREWLEGGKVVEYGAKTLPEGGYHAVPELATNGALLIGDDAGLTNVEKLKGLHYAIKSGMLAAEAIYAAIERGSLARDELRNYESLLNESFVMKDLAAAHNYRQVFAKAGPHLGAPLSLVQRWLPRLSSRPDSESLKPRRFKTIKVDGVDRLSDVSFSGTHHREEAPSHIVVADTALCAECKARFGLYPCEAFCPGEVYSAINGRLVLNPSNCLHCQTCRDKCPYENVIWQVPEGGDGPMYRSM